MCVCLCVRVNAVVCVHCVCVCVCVCVHCGWVKESQHQFLRIKSSYGRVYLFAAGSATSLSLKHAHPYTHTQTHARTFPLSVIEREVDRETG